MNNKTVVYIGRHPCVLRGTTGRLAKDPTVNWLVFYPDDCFIEKVMVCPSDIYLGPQPDVNIAPTYSLSDYIKAVKMTDNDTLGSSTARKGKGRGSRTKVPAKSIAGRSHRKQTVGRQPEVRRSHGQRSGAGAGSSKVKRIVRLGGEVLFRGYMFGLAKKPM